MRREGEPCDGGRTCSPRARIAVADHAHCRLPMDPVPNRATKAATFRYGFRHLDRVLSCLATQLQLDVPIRFPIHVIASRAIVPRQ